MKCFHSLFITVALHLGAATCGMTPLVSFAQTAPATPKAPENFTDIPAVQKKSVLFVLDVSGSMDPRAHGMLDEVKSTARSIVNKLENYKLPHSIGFITFSGCEDSDIKLQIDPADGSGGREFLNALNGTKAGGATALAKALKMSLQVLKQFKKKFPNDCLQIVLLTDGGESCGGDPVPVYKEILAENEKCKGSFKTIHLGQDEFESAVLESYFKNSENQVHHIDRQHSEEIKSVLDQTFGMESDAKMAELKQQQAGDSAKKTNPKQEKQKAKDTPPTPEPDQPADAEAEAKEKKEQQSGGNGGGGK